MADTPRITVGSAAATALQSSIQANLALRSWAEEDDAVMAEYVLVMLANSKTASQINAELADLIGPDYDESFTAWLWPEAQRIADAMRGKASPPPPTSASAQVPQREQRERRRSRSPAARETGRGRGREEVREREERRGPEAGVAQRWRAPPQQQQQQQQQQEERWGGRDNRMQDHRQARPLFNSALNAATGPSRATPQARTQPRQNGTGDDTQMQDTTEAESRTGRTMMDDPAYAEYQAVPQPNDGDEQVGFAGDAPTGPKAMRIRGAGANAAAGGLFARTMAQQQGGQANGHFQQQQQPPQQQPNPASILSRFAVPDPRAGAFTPSFSASTAPPAPSSSSLSLLSRLDPMVPLNADAPTIPTPIAPTPASHSAPWPSTPSEASLCRYGSRCTNPLCQFSHPSPSFARARLLAEETAQASGDTMMQMEDPLVLDSTACRYGTACTKLDCERSHTSAAQMFLLEKGVLPPEGGAAISPLQQQLQAAAPMASAFIASSSPPQAPKLASVPCKFQQNCTNTSCPFMHFQPRSSSSHGHFSSPTRTTSAAAAAGGASKIACRFGAACTRASCSFVHPAGRAMDIVGGAMELDREDAKKGRLARFATGSAPASTPAPVVKMAGTEEEATEGEGEKKEKEEEGYQSSATIKSDEEAVVV